MKKLLLTVAIVAVTGTSVFAQPKNNYNDENGTYDRVTKHGPYMTNRFFDNWFVGVGGGVNLYMGNDDDKADFGDRIAPALDVSLGKWFTPTVGLRLQYSGLSAKGATRHTTNYGTGDLIKQDGGVNYYEKEFNTNFVHADFLWNISHAIGGFKNTRTWNFVPYVGAGYVWASAKEGNTETNQLAATAGLLNNIRLGGVIDLTLEARYMLVKDAFDGEGGNSDYEGMASVTAGLTFKLGPKGGFKRPAYTAADYTPYQNRINSLESDLVNERANVDRLNRELEDAKSRPTGTVIEKVVTPVTIHSFFDLGKANVNEKDATNLKNLAELIKATPDKKYTVTGYADNATGTAARNLELSHERASHVAKVLVDQYGVKASQLVIEGKGGTDKFGSPAANRVVVIE